MIVVVVVVAVLLAVLYGRVRGRVAERVTTGQPLSAPVVRDRRHGPGRASARDGGL